ncbi:hypothetical protein NXS19_008743 [Fusarium pseudograminearum]|nr:hypothetical protein NXS19_008743 [Fusarium pseudograminearum]
METTSFNDFIQRYNTLQAYEASKDKLLQDVLIYCKAIESDTDKENKKLKARLNEVELDLKAATKTRRDLQKTLEEAELQVKWVMRQNDEIKNTNSYVLILIDGDGLLFDDSFTKQGLEGGKLAARALRTAVAQLCSHERTGSLEIICRVVANVGGLSKALASEGCIENPNQFRDFTQGFTQAKASFDFLDVGFGKERADAKIRETARWHLGNQNCKHILLGIGHDSGYAPFLEEVVHDDDTRHCVSLIKGPPLVRELDRLQMNIIEFDDIFRPTKLISDKTSALAMGNNRTLPIKTHTTATTSMPPTQAAVLTPATSTASLSPPNNSWAKITKSATPPPQLTMPLPPKQNKSKAAASRHQHSQPGAPGLVVSIPPLRLVHQLWRILNDEPETRNFATIIIFVDHVAEWTFAPLSIITRPPKMTCSHSQCCHVKILARRAKSATWMIVFMVIIARMSLMACAHDSIADSQGMRIHQTPSLSTRILMLTREPNLYPRMRFRLARNITR